MTRIGRYRVTWRPVAGLLKLWAFGALAYYFGWHAAALGLVLAIDLEFAP